MMNAVAADDRARPPQSAVWTELGVWKRVVGGESPTDLARFATIFLFFYGLDRTATKIASLTTVDTEAAVLVVRALEVNVAFAALGLGFGLLALTLRPAEVLVRWSGLEHGIALRRMLGPAIVLVVWRTATYDYNFLAGQWHWGDRILVVLLAIGAFARPVFLVPLAIQLRVMSQQFYFPTGQSSTVNIVNFVIFTILAVAAVHLLYVASRNRSTSPVLALVATMIASHFFEAGRGKLSLSWFPHDDIGNLAEASYLAGWLGGGDGEWARRLAELASSVNTLLLIGTLLVELGSIVALVHPRLLRSWLPAAVLLHVTVFVVTGYWFLSWIAVEIALIVILGTPSLRPWVRRSITPLRGLLGVLVVVALGEWLFYPPPLAWLDSPVSTAYQVDATGESGARYRLGAGEFAPFEEDVAFQQLEFAPRQSITYGYGAIYSIDLLRDLEGVDDFDALRAVEARQPLVSAADRVVATEFLTRYLEHLGAGPRRPPLLVAPPPLFWTDAPPPSPMADDRIVALEVYRVTSIHGQTALEPRRQLVLVVGLDPTGTAQVQWLAAESP